MMSDLLKFESDCMTIQIIYNSIGNKELGGPTGKSGERKKYINSLGFLYPDRDHELTNADDFNKLKFAVAPFYTTMLDSISQVFDEGNEINSAKKSIDDVMFEEKAKRFSLAFEN